MGSVKSSWWQVEVLAGFLIHHFVEMREEGSAFHHWTPSSMSDLLFQFSKI